MSFYFFVLFYILILFSIIGYGIVFKSIFFKFENINFGYLGIFGILFLLIFTYLINFFIPISSIFSSVLLSLGIIFFLNFLLKNFTAYKKDFYILISLFIILILFILSSKNHDDFPYYHFAYINIITQIENSFGLGNFNHGFRTPSSIFYLSSLFNLPKTNYSLIHIAPVFFLGFTNFILLKKIFLNFKEKKFFYLILLSILSLAFINIFFYRMAEHGTDRSAQILILLIFIETVEFIHKNYLNEELLKKLVILITITVSLKAFYIIYIILLLPLLIFQKNKINFLIKLISNKIFIICTLFFLILIGINFMNTGCLVYPLSISCFDSFAWSIPIEEVNYMNEWYQLWSKGGANPNYVVSDRANYISGFNWLSNWINIYFFNKVLDFISGLIFLILVVFIIFFTKKFNFKFFFNKKILLLYLIILLLFIEWFYNHPSLRYGGYHLLALLLFIPTAFLLDINVNFNKKLYYKINAILLITLIIFCSRNVNRIFKEVKLYNYNILENASYNEEFKNYQILNRILKIKKCNNDNSLCEKDPIKYQILLNKYVFYKKK